MPQGISHHSRSPHIHAAKKPKTKAKPLAVFQPTSSAPASSSTSSPGGPSARNSDQITTASSAGMSRGLLPLSKSHIRSASMSTTPSGARSASGTGKKRPREDEKMEMEVGARRTRSAGGGDKDRGESSSRDKEAAFQRQLIGVFVPRALKESVEGNTANYNDLVAHFLPKPLDPSASIALPPLLPLLRALTAHVSLLRPQLHAALVTAILGLPWATADDRFVKTYVGWAGVLVSAHPGWAKEVVAMAVKGFRWQPVFPEASTTITRRIFHARHHFLLAHLLSLIPTLPTVLQQVLQKNAPHKRDTEVAQATWVRNCCEMIEYCPELGARVWSGLVDKMLRIDVEITNRVEDDEEDDDDEDDEDDDEDDMIRPAAPAIDPFDLLISQDVPREGQTDDEDEDDDDDADPDIDELSTDGELESEEEKIIDEVKAAELRRQKREALKSLRCKLDAMLTHFLRHLNDCMGTGARGPSAAELGAQLNNTSLGSGSGSSSASSTPRPSRPSTPSTTVTPATRPPPTPAQSLAHFQTLLNLFSRQILPTSATQHLPFVPFHCASFSPAHTELFLHLLVLQALYARTTDAPTLASQPVSLSQRVAATVYIGSLVCRARFVSDDQARTVTQYLLAYVEGKLTQARDQPLPTLDELPLFYAVCQAIMLIFCFRWRAFRATTVSDECVMGEMEMDDVEDREASATGAGEWMSDLDTLQRAITSDLNPLLGCNTTVVSTFAKVAHATGFAYCFSIIEANQQAAARSNMSSSSTSSLPTPNSIGSNGKRVPSGAGASRASTHAITMPRRARQTNIDAGLDGYFPFDPYDLPRSGEFVESLYRTWDEVAVDLGGDSDSDDDDDDEDEEDDEMEEMVSSDEDAELAPGRQSVPKSVPHHIPRPSPRSSLGNSYGNRRRDLLRDGVLSTSLETMSISPNISA